MNRITLTLVVGFFALLEGCASTLQAKPEQAANFLHEKSQFGVAAEAVVPHVHAKTKTNWSAYNKIQLNPVRVSNDVIEGLDSEAKEELNQLATTFHDMLSERLSQDYILVQEPGPGTMAIQVAFRHAERSWIAPQVLSKLSWQLQAINGVVTLFRGKPAFAGEMTIEFAVHDAMTGKLLFAGLDRRVGGQNLFDKEVFNSWGDVQNSLEFWTEQSAYHLCLARKGTNCSLPKTYEHLALLKLGRRPRMILSPRADIDLPQLEEPVCCTNRSSGNGSEEKSAASWQRHQEITDLIGITTID
ncbi:MAG TPA: DUF3313 domain-containing protein [Nitrospira sp.]|nr:DUF3313 domain-containing protein [Nitrospira sp.]